jgi:uncharacterized protein (TIGR03083 family)
MKAELDAARSSAKRLRAVVEPLDDDALDGPTYPPGWSIADVLSHLGSMAEITRHLLDGVLSGRPVADDLRQQVWDEWNAKSSRRRAEDSLAEDGLLLDRFESLTDEERSRFSLDLGPLTVGAVLLLGMRVGEHAMHTWDIAVALDPTATVPPQVAAVTVEHFGPIAPLVGKTSGDDRRLVVHTTDPARHFVVELGESVSLTAGSEAAAPEVRLPMEAFSRLLFGRLDPDHTPAFEGEASVLEDLRRTFPGF